jgi:hypothetical protein
MEEGVSKDVREKGTRLCEEGKVKKTMDTDRRAYYDVEGETEKHSVIHDKTRGDWSCSCKYFSMRNRECSHICASKLSEKKSVQD